MNQPSANPNAPPNAEVSTSKASRHDRQFIPLWIWLGIAVVFSFLGTPADPVSMLIALACGLVSFAVGAILGSSLHLIVRVLAAVLGIVPAMLLTLLLEGRYFVGGALCYCLASIIIGILACRGIDAKRSLPETDGG